MEFFLNRVHNFEETIARLSRRQKSLPEGLGRDQLLEEISALDSIADVMRQALDQPAEATQGENKA